MAAKAPIGKNTSRGTHGRAIISEIAADWTMVLRDYCRWADLLTKSGKRASVFYSAAVFPGGHRPSIWLTVRSTIANLGSQSLGIREDTSPCALSRRQPS